ncbi:MAG TPA: asparagine synthetase B, partial [Rhodospirillaceae bacterium]|nr:asparagine synthetase B [Rhodospirillaceae bacterium]
RLGERMHKIGGILGMKNQEDIYQNLVSQWDSPETIVSGGGDFHTLATDHEWQPQNLSFAERMMYWDALSYLPGDILTKVDRASMA